MSNDPVLFELPPVFKVDAVVGQGAYGAVCRARLQHPHGCAVVAIKKVPQYAKSADCAKRVLREILILRHFQSVRQIVATHFMFRPLSQEKDLYIVMDYAPSDLSTFLKQSQQLNEDIIRFMVAQLLLGLRALHKGGCVHRDLSTRNVLLNERSEIQIADFGLARFFDPEERMSFGVVTQWYRAPEIVTDAQYSDKVDVWSVGVIMAELYMQGHIFPGKPNDLADQLNRIMRIIGVPLYSLFTNGSSTLSSSSDNAKRYVQRVCQSANPFRRTLFEPGGPRFKLEPSDPAKSFLGSVLVFDPDERPSAAQALQHPWFAPLEAYVKENVADQDADGTPFDQQELLALGDDLERLVAAIEDVVPVWNKGLEADAVQMAAEMSGAVPAQDTAASED